MNIYTQKVEIIQKPYEIFVNQSTDVLFGSFVE